MAPVITVSMPTFGTPRAMLRRAVSSVLAQDYSDIRLIVVSDGDQRGQIWADLGSLTDDPRLVVYEMGPERNMGRYYADAVTLAACDTPLWAMHDSDDQARPWWLSSMVEWMEESVADVVYVDQHVVAVDCQTTIFDPVLLPSRRGPVRFAHYAHGAALWQTDSLRSIGGPCPAFRVGYDTMLSTIAFAHMRVGIVRTSLNGRKLYVRHKRRGSLTTSPVTGMHSDFRRSQRVAMVDLWSTIAESAERSAIGPDETITRWSPAPPEVHIGAMVQAYAGSALLNSVESDAAALREIIRGGS